MVDVYNLMKW